MTYSWDPGYLAVGNKERYQTIVALPLTSQEPPETKEERVGPSSYRYVSQAPQFEGQVTVVLPPQTNSPTLMVVVNVGGELVWKQVLFGTTQNQTESAPYDSREKQRKPSGRRRAR